MTVVATPKAETVKEIRDLIASGDISLNDYRGHYRKHFNAETTLTDEQLTQMVARSDDDMDPPDWAKFMKALEEGKPFTLD